ncbi:MAG: hypothetical protein PVF27_10265 [Gemmatimonadales bacterium]|jgi:hypothetical protein
MIAARTVGTAGTVAALLFPPSASAQKDVPPAGRDTIPLSAYLPTAAELDHEDAAVAEGPGVGWGGDEGYERQFGEFGGTSLQLGASQFIMITAAAERFTQAVQPRMVLTMLTGMDPRALGEVFAQGAVGEMGEGILDSIAVTPLDDPQLGDLSAAFQIDWRASFMQFDMLMVLLSRGDLLVVVVAVSPPGEAVVEDLLPLAALIDGRIAEPTTIPASALATTRGEEVPAPVEPRPGPVEAKAWTAGWTVEEVREALAAGGLDVEAIDLPAERLPEGAELTESGMTPLLDGFGHLTRDIEGSPFFRYGSSRLFALTYEASVYRDAAVALLEQLAFEEQLRDTALITAMLSEGEEIPGAELAVEVLAAPSVGQRATGLRASVTASVLHIDAVIIAFTRGPVVLLVMAGGPGGEVLEEDVVALAGTLDQRLADALPGDRRAAPVPERVPALERLARATVQATNGDLDSALAGYHAALAAAPALERFATPAHALCKWGGLWNRGADVLPVCDRAVAAADGYLGVHDARGVARAVAGEFAGAIDDLEIFAAWTDSGDARAKRREWIAALERGENPFTEAVREELRRRTLAR